MKRRHFIKTTGGSLAALLLSQPFKALADENDRATDSAYPDAVSAIVNDGLVQLTGGAGKWQWNNLGVSLVKKNGCFAVEIEAPNGRTITMAGTRGFLYMDMIKKTTQIQRMFNICSREFALLPARLKSSTLQKRMQHHETRR